MKRYTAQEMREMASAVLDECEDSEHGLLYLSRYFSGHLFCPDDVAAMLRQAADMMEREEKREKIYEYACLNRVFQTLNVARIYAIANEIQGQRPVIVRREVGVWEVVKDES